LLRLAAWGRSGRGEPGEIALTRFLRCLGLAIAVDVVTEIAMGVWGVHAGHLYPWRHLDILPLYGTHLLALEWGLRLLCGAALILVPHRRALTLVTMRVGAVVLFVTTLERYSNHAALIFLLTLFVGLSSQSLGSTRRVSNEPTLGLVRAQLVIVYVFSALNKVAHGFLNGGSLSNLAGGRLSLEVARPLSWCVVAVEFAIPLLLKIQPRVGLVLVIGLHAAFSVFMPHVTSFGLAMLAMALLFQPDPPAASYP
jgi:hypothetical protein